MEMFELVKFNLAVSLIDFIIENYSKLFIKLADFIVILYFKLPINSIDFII